jgi:hypothetical protein
MSTQKTAIGLFYCAAILLISGILLFVLEQIAASVTMISMLVVGVLSGVIGFLMTRRLPLAFWGGLIIASVSVLYFGWLTGYNSQRLVDMLLNGNLQLKPYNALYLQIYKTLLSLVAVFVSIITSRLQFINSSDNANELAEYNKKA